MVHIPKARSLTAAKRGQSQLSGITNPQVQGDSVHRLLSCLEQLRYDPAILANGHLVNSPALLINTDTHTHRHTQTL